MSEKQQLIVGSYNPADQPGIFTLSFDPESGECTLLGSFSGLESPSFLALHPNNPWLYTVSETGEGSHGAIGSVVALRFGESPGELHQINSRSTDGDWPCHVEVDHTGRWIVVSNYGTGNAASYPILEDGRLGEMASVVQHEGTGPNEARQERAHAHSATFTPDNRYVIIADLGIDQLMVYAFDHATGQMTLHAEVATTPGAGPRHLAFHPDGDVLYVANELDSSVGVYQYDGELGTFTSLQTISTLPEGAPENTVADIHLSAAGDRLYVSNRGHNSLAVYEIRADKQLNRLAVDSCGGNWPRNFAISSDGRYVLVGNRRSGTIATIPVRREGGEIGPAAAHLSLPEPSCLLFK